MSKTIQVVDAHCVQGLNYGHMQLSVTDEWLNGASVSIQLNHILLGVIASVI